MKRSYWVVALASSFCVLTACQGKTAMGELEKSTVRAQVEEQNKKVVKRFFDEFN